MSTTVYHPVYRRFHLIRRRSFSSFTNPFKREQQQPSLSPADSTWRTIQLTRLKDRLLTEVYYSFDADSLERKLLRENNEKYTTPIMKRWATYLVDNGLPVSEDVNGRPTLPPEVEEDILASGNYGDSTSIDPDLEFLVTQLANPSPDATMSRGPAHFPSLLLRKGPSFPFQTSEYRRLQKHLGNIKGHECTTMLKLKDMEGNSSKASSRPQRVQNHEWESGCHDDDDFIADRRRLQLKA